PTGDHVACEVRRLLDVIGRARGTRAIDDLLRRAPAEHADDARAQIRFWIVVAVGLRALIRHAERLAARHDGDSTYWIGTGHDQAQNGMAAFVIGDALAIFIAEEN